MNKTNNLRRPFTNKGIPSDYWLLLSMIKNGRLYTRKELTNISSVRALRTLSDANLIEAKGNKFVVSGSGLSYYDKNKPVGASGYTPVKVKKWKVITTYNKQKEKFITRVDSMKEAKIIAKQDVDHGYNVKRINIHPST